MRKVLPLIMSVALVVFVAAYWVLNYTGNNADLADGRVCVITVEQEMCIRDRRDAGITQGITVVYSHEEPQRAVTADVPGSMVFVPACAGMMMASYIVQKIIAGQD